MSDDWKSKIDGLEPLTDGQLAAIVTKGGAVSNLTVLRLVSEVVRARDVPAPPDAVVLLGSLLDEE